MSMILPSEIAIINGRFCKFIINNLELHVESFFVSNKNREYIHC